MIKGKRHQALFYFLSSFLSTKIKMSDYRNYSSDDGSCDDIGMLSYVM